MFVNHMRLKYSAHSVLKIDPEIRNQERICSSGLLESLSNCFNSLLTSSLLGVYESIKQYSLVLYDLYVMFRRIPFALNIYS